MSRDLNQLPNGIVKSASPTASGEVSDINFGGLTASNMGDPVIDTDGVSKGYLDNRLSSPTALEVLNVFYNTDDQLITALDTWQTIKFSNSAVTGDGVDIAADGTFTCTRDGVYCFNSLLYVKRDTGGSTASIGFFRVIKNGTTNLITPFFQNVNSTTTIGLYISINFTEQLTSSDTIAIQMQSDSAWAGASINTFSVRSTPNSAMTDNAPGAQMRIIEIQYNP